MLHVHRAERADPLVAALGTVLAEPLDDPLAPEVVAVPTRGVERWITQQLSARLGATPGRADGVCANVSFPFPGRLVDGAVAAASGVAPARDPWVVERAVWPLLDVVDGHLGEEWLAALAAHLGAACPDSDPLWRSRRFATVRRVADLYDRYAVHRPEMLRAWARGHDTDGDGRTLPPFAVWQAQLWRLLRRRIGAPGPAERLVAACAALRAEPTLSDLPPRLSLFGLTRLPASHLAVLSALAASRDVHLFLLHPSPALWDAVREGARREPVAVRRSEDRSVGLVHHPLLASWGQDVREMQLVLAGAEGSVTDHHHPLERPPATLLARLQADVRADRAPPGIPLPGGPDARAPLPPGDRSLQVHACHGRSRQVEVVRDAILHLLDEDPTLEPRDIILMCPDIETFAPLVHATFGGGPADGDGREEGHGQEGGHGQQNRRPPDPGRPDLRVRLADRALRQTNPVFGVVAALLTLADARVTASQVLDLAGRDPVRRRFRFDDDDLARAQEWVAATGVRWGLDAAHRAPFHLDAVDANTWRSGLDRVLLGVAVDEEGERLVGGVLPLDDVDSGDIDLAGRLAELVDRLQGALGELAGPLPVDGWAAALARAAQAMTSVSGADEWQRAQLSHLLDDVVEEASGGGTPSPSHLSLPEVRALLAPRLQGRATRANFRTGHLTVCTLVPMRSVPHRAVCLLGLDDGAFPRRTAADGDDLVAADPHVGDREARSEDRQLLLDALLAATDHLVITYTGRDERTNAPRPPAVPVGELLDVVDRTVRSGATGPDGSPLPARERIIVRHPLLPFDARNFTDSALVPGRTWSFDAVALDGARALSGPRSEAPPFLDRPLPPVAGPLVELDGLVAFVAHPVRAFLRQRLGVSVSREPEELAGALPVELDGLARWGVGQRLLAARLAGVDPEASRAAELARGTLPPGALARGVLAPVGRTVEGLMEAAAELVGGDEAASVEVDLTLPDGRTLVGTVTDVRGDVAGTVIFSRVGPKHRLAAWVRFLALTAAHPARPIRAATIGRARLGASDGARVTVAQLAPLAGDAAARREAALAHLAGLVDLYDRGMREPLPLYCATSAAHAEAVAGGGSPRETAARAWTSDWEQAREDQEPEHLLVLGGQRPFAEVVAAGPRPDEEGAGWMEAEASRFGRYALRLWRGLLACEAVVDR